MPLLQAGISTTQQISLAERVSISVRIAVIAAIGIGFAAVIALGIGIMPAPESKQVARFLTQQERVLELTVKLTDLNGTHYRSTGDERTWVLRTMQEVADERFSHLKQLAGIDPQFVLENVVPTGKRIAFPVEVQPLVEVARTVEGVVGQGDPMEAAKTLATDSGETLQFYGSAEMLAKLRLDSRVSGQGVAIGSIVVLESVTEIQQ